MQIRIGTRRSDLARWQAQKMAQLIISEEPTAGIRMVYIGSLGDSNRRSNLQDIGSVGVFTKSGELALLNHDVDVIVHSLKDLPTILPDPLILGMRPTAGGSAWCSPWSASCRAYKRAASRNRFDTTRGATAIYLSRDWNQANEGECPSWLWKALNQSGIDGTILAAAGLIRLGLVDERIEFLDPSIFPYAVGQGALGVECRRNDTELVSLLKSIEHRVSRAEVDAERALMGHLGAGCSLPLGVYGYWHGDVFTMYARVTSPDGSRKIQATGSAGAVDTENLGRIVSELLLEAGAGAILTEVAAQACLGTTTQKLY